MQRARHLISFPASIFFFFLIFPISIFRSADNTVDNYSSSHTFALFWFFPRFSNCHLFFIIFFFLLSSSFLPSFLPSLRARMLPIHYTSTTLPVIVLHCTRTAPRGRTVKASVHQYIASGGTLGQLAMLDTHTPSMYIELPEGRIKYNGYRQYINSRLITLECKPTEMSCPDQFDNLIVFTEALCTSCLLSPALFFRESSRLVPLLSLFWFVLCVFSSAVLLLLFSTRAFSCRYFLNKFFPQIMIFCCVLRS